MINSGYTIENPIGFTKRFYKLFYGAMGISSKAPIEDIEINLDEDDDEDTKKTEGEGDKKEDETKKEGEADKKEEDTKADDSTKV